MDNQTRSEISRRKAIEAALTILTRDGVGGLTFDSLSRESGISKGGLLHQFRTRHGVLCALLDYQQQQFEQISRDYLKKEGSTKAEPILAARIAIYREAIKQPNSVARASLAALIESPALLEEIKTTDEAVMQAVQDGAADPDLSLLRYFAASGIAFHAMLGMSTLSESARKRLFERLLDEKSWESRTLSSKRRSARSAG
ncbi:TetR/AcrR family transcriptional regulator [Paraburkholderia sp. 40]|uniref:TetR/AcrR family transcriptional regulator n=1 Tax=Paraburkholderia sp. 40 TaxID=2991059 RepID=UPI003D256A81